MSEDRDHSSESAPETGSAASGPSPVTDGVEHDPPVRDGDSPPADGVPPPADPSIPGPPPGGPRRRFIVSQLLARHPTRQMRHDMVDVFNLRLERALLPHVDVISDTASANRATGGRRVVVVEADPAELAAKVPDLTADAVAEVEKPRTPAVLSLRSPYNPYVPGSDPGTGGALRLAVKGEDDRSIAGATVVAQLMARDGSGRVVEAGSFTGQDGVVAVPFNPGLWIPLSCTVDADFGYWSMTVAQPQSGQTVRLQALSRSGPFGWWHLLSGAPAYDPDAGRGITVGLIDMCVGPHPYLDHVVPYGSILSGTFVPGAAAGRDASDHGTHVAGLIGARPTPESGDFGGLAPGASVVAARVFAADRSANQGDIAAAVDALSFLEKADLINMSLGGADSSIERDAVTLAFQNGTLCLAASGNGYGAPVLSPANYPECVAVTALGLLGTCPSTSLAAINLPGSMGYGIGGLFLADFSNIGPEIACTAGGNGIVSTVPSRDGESAPYAVMIGTSVATPLATGALAVALAADQAYQDLPRTAERSAHARRKLVTGALSVGLPASSQGCGLARV